MPKPKKIKVVKVVSDEPVLNMVRAYYNLVDILVFKGHINRDEANRLLQSAIVVKKR